MFFFLSYFSPSRNVCVAPDSKFSHVRKIHTSLEFSHFFFILREGKGKEREWESCSHFAKDFTCP